MEANAPGKFVEGEHAAIANEGHPPFFLRPMRRDVVVSAHPIAEHEVQMDIVIDARIHLRAGLRPKLDHGRVNEVQGDGQVVDREVPECAFWAATTRPQSTMVQTLESA